MNFHTRSLSFVMSFVFLALAGIVKAEDVSSDKLPFVPTKIVNNQFATDTKWYTMSIREGKMLSASTEVLTCEKVGNVDKGNLWCFVADGDGRYAIYSLSAGVDYVVYSASSSSGESMLLKSKKAIVGGVSSFSLCKNGTGYSFYYPGKQTACWNDFSSAGRIAIWDFFASPSDVGSRIVFAEYDASKFVGTDDNADNLLPVSGDILYVNMKNNAIDAFPVNYIKSKTENTRSFVIVDQEGVYHSYDKEEVESIGTTCSMEFPMLNAFSFDASENNMLMEDAVGTICTGDTVRMDVGSIGKRLYPTIKTSDESCVIYINGKTCESMKTSHRFAKPAVCTLTYPDCNMLRKKSDGSLVMHPFGREYVVDARFLCDSPTTEYGVPVVRINTNDGTMISSKDYYWDATIEIDGAGFFPDLKKTDVQIKGRGNTSWNGNMAANPKNPYRLKFPSKKKVLGMTSAKNWVLIANAQKGSMLCNMIGSRAAEMVECAAANHFIPVELYINGDYRGSYNITEKVGFAKNSIVVNDETVATLIELDSYYDEVYKFKTTNYNIPVNIKEPDLSDPESTSLEFSDIQKSFNRFVNELKSHGDISKYADIKSIARYFFLNELVLNFEIMHPKSTYCYNENVKDEASKYIFGPVWDFDWAFGYESARNYFTTDSSVDFWTGKSFSGKSFIYDLRYSGEKFNRQYYRVWHDFYTNHLEELKEYIDDYYDVVMKSYQHDQQIRNSGGTSLYTEQVRKAKSWLNARANYVYNHLSNDLGYKDKDYLIVDDPDDAPSAIEMIPQESSSLVTGVYDIFGRRLSSDVNSLPKGIYVIEGRKVVKR